jgi:hypothetical protein
MPPTTPITDAVAVVIVGEKNNGPVGSYFRAARCAQAQPKPQRHKHRGDDELEHGESGDDEDPHERADNESGHGACQQRGS